MARVVVTSGCYLGDVAPYVEPANRLVERGHDVTYCVPTGFHDLLAGERFSLARYGLDLSVRAFHADPLHQRLMQHPFRNQTRLARYWIERGFTGDPAAATHSLLAALDGADVVLSHPTFAYPVVPVARSLGVRVVIGHLFPMLVPTSERTPALGWPGVNLGAPLNRVSWKAMALGSGLLMGDRVTNEHRRRFGLRPRRGNVMLAWDEADRVVTLLSRHYAGPEPHDWDAGTMVGFSHWPGPPRPTDPAVDAYVDAGEPPVLVCLGSSAASGAADAFRTMADGIEALGLRPLLLVGNEENADALRGRPGVFAFAPIAPLLPRCRVAVVSGGLGTLAAALTAGVPTVVVPQLFDQVWHGARVARLGVGEMVLRTANVAKAVATIERDPGYAERARALAAAMAGEDGAGALVDAVESVLT